MHTRFLLLMRTPMHYTPTWTDLAFYVMGSAAKNLPIKLSIAHAYTDSFAHACSPYTPTWTDLAFYVMGSAEENELLLMAALSCLVQTVDTILHRNLGK